MYFLWKGEENLSKGDAPGESREGSAEEDQSPLQRPVPSPKKTPIVLVTPLQSIRRKLRPRRISPIKTEQVKKMAKQKKVAEKKPPCTLPGHLRTACMQGSSEESYQSTGGPRWTSDVRVEMNKKGLYKKHSIDHPLLQGFFHYLRVDLGNKRSKRGGKCLPVHALHGPQRAESVFCLEGGEDPTLQADSAQLLEESQEWFNLYFDHIRPVMLQGPRSGDDATAEGHFFISSTERPIHNPCNDLYRLILLSSDTLPRQQKSITACELRRTLSWRSVWLRTLLEKHDLDLLCPRAESRGVDASDGPPPKRARRDPYDCRSPQDERGVWASLDRPDRGGVRDQLTGRPTAKYLFFTSTQNKSMGLPGCSTFTDVWTSIASKIPTPMTTGRSSQSLCATTHGRRTSSMSRT
ncbi:unnamed protein product [Leuciscus chuanchicus]